MLTTCKRLRCGKVTMALLAASLLAACAKTTTATASGDAGTGAASAPPGAITVTVVSSDPKAETLTVKGSGLPAPDKNGEEVLKVVMGDTLVGYDGHQVQGVLSKSEGAWWLNNVWPADPNLVAETKAATQAIDQDLLEQGRKAYRDVGDYLPAFALYNQNGEVIRPEALRGRKLVINFIFTHCTNPTMCPANSARMVQLQKAVKAAKLDDVTFVTISFDPVNDTPGVLREYAQGYGMDLSNYQLLTGPPDEMKAALQEFGILIKNENGTLVHSMATYIISPQGRVTYRKDGESWTLKEFIDRLTPSTDAKA